MSFVQETAETFPSESQARCVTKTSAEHTHALCIASVQLRPPSPQAFLQFLQ